VSVSRYLLPVIRVSFILSLHLLLVVDLSLVFTRYSSLVDCISLPTTRYFIHLSITRCFSFLFNSLSVCRPLSHSLLVSGLTHGIYTAVKISSECQVELSVHVILPDVVWAASL